MTKYTRPPLRLTFSDGTEYAGLVVRMKRLTIGQYLDPDSALNGSMIGFLGRGESDRALQLADRIAEHIIEWNLFDEAGLPVSHGTGMDLFDCDPAMVDTIARSWVDRSVGVPDPLASKSENGAPFLEGSIPMETPSPARTN